MLIIFIKRIHRALGLQKQQFPVNTYKLDISQKNKKCNSWSHYSNSSWICYLDLQPTPAASYTLMNN
ncbi:hypothetical protein GDO78_000851 [Eleutherodactylus coqui]|uniref:Uncharacterized protein n=1 Tax=Eleutherodactylus coqui TaxID=57060 RepID=A0A8J6KG31_ELECQ|nr:hypothetical protein GDO78_000851 [Eleutherodactylus coqui]